jgi:hypothetical protein
MMWCQTHRAAQRHDSNNFTQKDIYVGFLLNLVDNMYFFYKHSTNADARIDAYTLIRTPYPYL